MIDLRKRRRIYLALTLGVMVTIFWFSAQPADESSELSGRFMAWLLSGKVPFLTWFVTTTRIFDWLSLRKCAHAFIYFTLGICACLTAGTWEGSRKTKAGLAWLFCILYAGTDELHQRFVPGRSCELRDVMIDSSGALAGILLVLLIGRVLRMRRRRQETMTERFWRT